MIKQVFTLLILFFRYWNGFGPNNEDAKDMVMGGLDSTTAWTELDGYGQSAVLLTIYKYQTGKRGTKCN